MDNVKPMLRVDGNCPVSKPVTMSDPANVPNSGSNMGQGDQMNRSRPYKPMLAEDNPIFLSNVGLKA